MFLSPFRASAVAALASFLLLAGCGGDSSPVAPAPLPSSAPNATRTILDASSFSLAPGAATYKNIDLPPAGALDAVVTWPGNNDINLYVTDNVCPGFVDLRAGRCNIVARSDGPATKPERVSFSTAAGKIWTFWIHNNGSSPESGSVEVGITTDQPIPGPTPEPPRTQDPRAGLAPGPVVRFTVKVRSIDVNKRYRDPFQDEEGYWIVYPGEFVVYDSTQKNAGGELCQWVNDPVWTVRDPEGIMILRGSSQPFLLRTDVDRRGTAEIYSTIDGVESNRLLIRSVRRP